MTKTRDYLEEALQRARGYLPDYLWEEIHNRARSHAGGKAKGKKEARDGDAEESDEGAGEAAAPAEG